jgi:hypothetical protein
MRAYRLDSEKREEIYELQTQTLTLISLSLIIIRSTGYQSLSKHKIPMLFRCVLFF